MSYQVKRFPIDGAVDADGHVLEPAWLWEHYLEARYQDRAMGIGIDDEGFEFLQLDGKPSQRTVKGALGLMGAMGEVGVRPSPERKYMDHMPFGAADAGQRVDLLDQENLLRSVLYPTIGLLWEAEVTDPEITVAYCRAYNRWIADFCRDSAGGWCPSPTSAWSTPKALPPNWSARSRTAARAVSSARSPTPANPTATPTTTCSTPRRSSSDVPIAIHPTFEPTWAMPIRFDGLSRGEASFFYNVINRQGMQQAFLSFWTCGTLDRFPTLQLGLLEAGCGWVGAFLDRMDAVWDTMVGQGLSLKMQPSEYFRRQCFVSGDPDETAAPYTFDHVGADRFMWATDYPHPDHPGTWVDALSTFVAPLSPETRAKVLGGNTDRIYNLV